MKDPDKQQPKGALEAHSQKTEPANKYVLGRGRDRVRERDRVFV